MSIMNRNRYFRQKRDSTEADPNLRHYNIPMLEIARWFWTLALTGAIVALVLTGRWRQLPLFTLWLLATAIQTAAHFSNIDVDGSWWLKWTPALSALKTLAVAECAWKLFGSMQSRFAWIAALAGISGGATLAAARVRPDTRPWLEAAMVMRHFEAGLLAFLLLAMMAGWIWGTGDRLMRAHIWAMGMCIAIVLSGLLAYEATPQAWWGIMAATYLGVGLCYVAWTILFVRGFRSAPRDDRTYAATR